MVKKVITIQIDEKKISVDENMCLLESALQNGIYIPHLCHHKDLPDIGSCRLCLVRNVQTGEIGPSCMIMPEEGMEFITSDDEINRRRNLAMALLLAAHPEDCSTCVKYGNCEFQTLIQYMGASAAGMRNRAKGLGRKEDSLLLIHEMDRCVLCGRCVRMCGEIRKVKILDYRKKGNEIYIGTENDKSLQDADCRFCTACAEVCPTGAIRDRIMFLKNEKEKKLVPCRNACPAGTDIPRYLRKVREQNYEEAASVIREKLTFPEILGQICTHVCEKECRRGLINEPVAIRDLKRRAVHLADQSLWKEKRVIKSATGKKICVVGSGPSGLTAAYYLKKQGHDVCVKEALPEPGGMLRYGIPEYRLSRELVAKEIRDLTEIGIDLETNCRVDSPGNLVESYDAVLLAMGNHTGVRLPMEGSNLSGVILNIDFLRECAMNTPPALGDNVVVLGGGNVAFDCARTARRLGVKNVSVACLEKKADMTADAEEILMAEEEGIHIYPGVTFEKICGSEKVEAVELSEIESFTFDENRKAVIVKRENSESRIKADQVIFAVGQRCSLPEDAGIERGRAGSVNVLEDGITTPQEKIFACGDVTYGTRSVVQGVASGRKAAEIIDRYLGGDGDISEQLAKTDAYEPEIGKIERFADLERQKVNIVEVSKRLENFNQEDQGLDEEASSRESMRCLQCDKRLCISEVRTWTAYSEC
ncbi:MAG: FAD-dependent oxidoreductase [Lachnospiraceae bacterium]